MADIVWPASLPTAPRVADHSEQPPELTIRFGTDIGPAQVRARTTTNPRLFEVSMLMTKAQLDTFDEFYLSTTSGGALPFEFSRPRDGTTIDVRFASRPRYKPTSPRTTTGRDYWEVTFTLEDVPATAGDGGGGGDGTDAPMGGASFLWDTSEPDEWVPPVDPEADAPAVVVDYFVDVSAPSTTVVPPLLFIMSGDVPDIFDGVPLDEGETVVVDDAMLSTKIPDIGGGGSGVGGSTTVPR